jgi:hypothetical protein
MLNDNSMIMTGGTGSFWKKSLEGIPGYPSTFQKNCSLPKG